VIELVDPELPESDESFEHEIIPKIMRNKIESIVFIALHSSE
jgi:hypothetical protein